jgi:hypothetical protein
VCGVITNSQRENRPRHEAQKRKNKKQQSKGQPTNNQQQQQVITANLLACSGSADKLQFTKLQLQLRGGEPHYSHKSPNLKHE